MQICIYAHFEKTIDGTSFKWDMHERYGEQYFFRPLFFT